MLQNLLSKIIKNKQVIEDFFNKKFSQNPALLYNSIDLRHSGFKIAPVDTNCFPAGFNNLSLTSKEIAKKLADDFLTKNFGDVQNILLIPENHTRNLRYLENVLALKNILNRNVEIGSLIADLQDKTTIDLENNQSITLNPLIRNNDKITTKDGFCADLIILNHDLTDGIPEILQNLTIPIIPSPNLGWHNRTKSNHFTIYNQLAEELAKIIEIDPWLISSMHKSCDDVDFKEQKGIECLAKSVDELLKKIKIKYQEYDIKEEPYCFIKADNGTYGMAVWPVFCVEDVLEINKKERNKMNMLKGSIKNTKVMIQEGIKTIDKIDGKISEAMIYLITFIAIIATDLVEGVQAGISVAFLLVAIRMLKTKTNIRLWTNQVVMRVGLTGGMTFWSFDRLSKLEEYVLEHTGLRFVVFEFNEVSGLDSSGAGHLITAAQTIASGGIKIIFHGLSQEQENIINANTQGDHVWSYTHTESEIKIILEASGVEHSAKDVLRHGMQKYLVDFAKERKQLISTLAQGQNPHTLLITCSDSRLNPNSFLSSGLGELFIVRNVGNVVPVYEANSQHSEVAAIEFALGSLGIRNIVICAHTDCGAVKSVLSGACSDDSGLSNWLKRIRIGYGDELPDNVSDGVRLNLLNQINNLKTYPVVNKLLEEASLGLSAWVYDVSTADMMEWSFESGQLVSLVKEGH